MKSIYYILSIATVLVIFSCANPPDFPLEPIITYESISTNTINQSAIRADSAMITISFTDGDGDLGREDMDSVDIFIIDNRIDFLQPGFVIPFIGQQGVGKGISGEISFLAPPNCCIFENGLPPCQPSTEFPIDTVTYDIYIVDRAGNESNRVTTEPIFIRCN